MKSKLISIFSMLIVISMLVGCGAPTTAPTQPPAATEAPAATTAPPVVTEAPVATTPPVAATEAPAADVKSFQADMTNLFPNGIGEVSCQGVNLVVATQTGPQIASPMENHWKEWGAKTGDRKSV